MKKMLLVLGVLWLAACQKEESPSLAGAEANAPQSVMAQDAAIAERVRAQNAELEEKNRQESIRNERLRIAQLLADVFDRWLALQGQAEGKNQEQLAPIVTKLREVKADAEKIEVNECTAPLRSALLGGMDILIGAFQRFLDQSLQKPDPGIPEEVKRGAEAVIAVQPKIPSCKEAVPVAQ